MTTTNRKKTSYKDAGVDIERGNLLVERIKKTAGRTHGSAVMSGLGGFGALYDLSCLPYKNPVLVSGTDGVGTKIKIAMEMNKHDTIGIDLVAMCVNDLLVQGATPLFFLDYYACAKLDVDIAEIVIDGIAQGCHLAGCSLTGGETAEMPGIYAPGDYDLAGFCVGIVEREKIIDGSKVKPGDVLIGIASSGPHANGYSLIRQLLDQTDTHYEDKLNGKTMGDIILEPTRIYAAAIQLLLDKVPVNSLAHITGGGLIENLPRVMPTDCQAVIDTNSWQWPPIFSWLQEQGNIDTDEMFRTFNCGVGMVVCLDKTNLAKALESLKMSGESAWVIGHIEHQEKDTAAVVFLD